MTDHLAREHRDFLTDSLADDAPADPLALFDVWMDDAFARRTERGDLTDPSAVVLSTVAFGSDGAPRPRSRTVLLKGHDASGFVVYTNLASPKAAELQATPQAAMLLPWYALQRQVRIEGSVEHLPAAESDAYWAQRPRGSQLGAWASHQSDPVDSRAALDAQYEEVAARFEGVEVPRPSSWGGLRLVPDRMEFWQGRENRFHDRIAYELASDGTWQRHRLQP
ncbi:pyridoxamine 5'-phosphate oxidase [Brachybacterium sp. P6-10-X1]|uniref:pyridoxamine 5'-phosphate oxidase n=1 Tax=Brachybacterium sp. P6-10-X1 TaxID=1903186 RepID=UPI000971AFE4|nr:pyridoxamine 5'-phosphate oxidase [Brachybacterium sp. P6-10-X1]APX33358.1 pyridoxamine 5'-phosphate oxidase [Brachybacterium sp. P6-10-X1]